MAHLSSEDDYHASHYFENRHGDQNVAHVVGNSTQNLTALADTTACAPGPHLELPEAKVHQPPAEHKPARSDPDEAAALAAAAPPAPQEPVFVHTDASLDGDYYAVIRRRSLEGRCPTRFSDTGARTLEETMASEELDVALY